MIITSAASELVLWKAGRLNEDEWLLDVLMDVTAGGVLLGQLVVWAVLISEAVVGGLVVLPEGVVVDWGCRGLPRMRKLHRRWWRSRGPRARANKSANG